MTEPTDEQILSALGESGFLFEHACATALERLGFHVDTSWAFADAEEGKSRELDLRATKFNFRNEEHRIQVFAELLVECKDFDAPLVFLERSKNERELKHPSGSQCRFPRAHYRKDVSAVAYQEVPGFEFFNLKAGHYYYEQEAKATQFVKIVRKGDRWSANHDGVHDAIVLPLAKALESRKAELPKQSQTANKGWCQVWLFFPVVLVRNRLLVHNLSSSLPLEDRGRVTYVRELHSRALHDSYLFDFVRFDYLETYVATEVMPFVEKVVHLTHVHGDAIRGGPGKS